MLAPPTSYPLSDGELLAVTHRTRSYGGERDKRARLADTGGRDHRSLRPFPSRGTHAEPRVLRYGAWLTDARLSSVGFLARTMQFGGASPWSWCSGAQVGFGSHAFEDDAMGCADDCGHRKTARRGGATKQLAARGTSDVSVRRWRADHCHSTSIRSGGVDPLLGRLGTAMEGSGGAVARF